jgi:hypothetical protein
MERRSSQCIERTGTLTTVATLVTGKVTVGTTVQIGIASNLALWKEKGGAFKMMGRAIYFEKIQFVK